jgi:hypothetical protein
MPDLLRGNVLQRKAKRAALLGPVDPNAQRPFSGGFCVILRSFFSQYATDSFKKLPGLTQNPLEIRTSRIVSAGPRGCRHEIGFAGFGGVFVIVLRQGRSLAGARQGRQTKKVRKQPERREHMLM